MTMLSEVVDVVIGVDTHKHTHTAAVVSAAGGLLESTTQPTDPAGYRAILELADRHPGMRVWAIEGCNSYGAGLARMLVEHGETVIELDRPTRSKRRHGAKSDEIDAQRAAREALSRRDLGSPRSNDQRAALQTRLTVRRSAVEAAGDAQRQLDALVTTAPEILRERFRQLSIGQLVARCAQLRLNPRWDLATRETACVLRHLARRISDLTSEAADHERAILALVRSWRPDLLERQGVGPIVAAHLLCAWSHPERFRNDAAFAMLAGTAPIPASSGQTVRHRLNRSGDRQLNRAIHTIVLTRLRHDPTTRAYAERRRAEGRTDREIRRCLKRYITRPLFRQLENPPLDTP